MNFAYFILSLKTEVIIATLSILEIKNTSGSAKLCDGVTDTSSLPSAFHRGLFLYKDCTFLLLASLKHLSKPLSFEVPLQLVCITEKELMGRDRLQWSLVNNGRLVSESLLIRGQLMDEHSPLKTGSHEDPLYLAGH